jgi:hypothetical protein
VGEPPPSRVRALHGLIAAACSNSAVQCTQTQTRTWTWTGCRTAGHARAIATVSSESFGVLIPT